MNNFFRRFAQAVSRATGSAWSFILSILLVVVWAVTGPTFGYSDTWQLVINTGTTIITFLMVFLIQNTQNRDSRAIHLKLDELLRAATRARTQFAELENLTDDELERIEQEFRELCRRERGRRTGRLEHTAEEEHRREEEHRSRDERHHHARRNGEQLPLDE